VAMECASCGAPKDPNANKCPQCDTPYSDIKDIGLGGGLSSIHSNMFETNYVSADLTNESNVIKPEFDFGNDPGQTIKKALLVGAAILVVLIVIGSIKSCSSTEVGSQAPVESKTEAPSVVSNAGSVSSGSLEQEGEQPGALSPDTAVSFVEDYISKSGSEGGTSAYSLVNMYYADRINYFGKETDRSVVLKEKVNYERRWSERSYAIEDGTLRTNCLSNGQTCFVSGIMSYEANSPERQAHGSGRAQFEFGVGVTSGGIKIVSENSSVIH
jgi:hypothetical protein